MSELVRFEDIARHYGAREVFAGVTGVVRAGDRIAVVGPNGAGKSSLVRLLTGADEPDGGRIVRARGVRVGYLAQDAAAADAGTLGDVYAALRGPEGAGDWELRALLRRFDFTDADLARPLAAFSGGQRTRALLARTLAAKPDWFVLDEPTNHLDVATVRRLESFVAADRRAFVLVSHDRYFIETLANRIWELDAGVLEAYDVTPGSAYSEFLAQRAERRTERLRVHRAALEERKRARAVVDELRTHGSHNYRQVRSREKALARIDEAAPPPEAARAIGVRLSPARRGTTGFAVEAQGLTKGYDRPLFADFSATFSRIDRVAIVGPNGAGKTTLLRVLRGDLAPDRGSVRYGSGISTASTAQSAADDLPAGVTAAQAVTDAGVDDETARALLGRLRLGGDAGDKPVEAFSGGERRRIMLARLMARRADCLFLDEPTNDLDIPSREALEDVLADYGGTLFVVSHDRYLLKRLARRVVALEDGRATLVDGDYAAYERRQHAAGDQAPPPEAAPNSRAAKLERQAAHEARTELGRRKRAVAQAEQRVADLDAERAEIERRFAAPDLYADAEAVVRLQHEMERVREASATAMAAWERALDALES